MRKLIVLAAILGSTAHGFNRETASKPEQNAFYYGVAFTMCVSNVTMATIQGRGQIINKITFDKVLDQVTKDKQAMNFCHRKAIKEAIELFNSRITI